MLNRRRLLGSLAGLLAAPWLVNKAGASTAPNLKMMRPKWAECMSIRESCEAMLFRLTPSQQAAVDMTDKRVVYVGGLRSGVSTAAAYKAASVFRQPNSSVLCVPAVQFHNPYMRGMLCDAGGRAPFIPSSAIDPESWCWEDHRRRYFIEFRGYHGQTCKSIDARADVAPCGDPFDFIWVDGLNPAVGDSEWSRKEREKFARLIEALAARLKPNGQLVVSVSYLFERELFDRCNLRIAHVRFEQRGKIIPLAFDEEWRRRNQELGLL